MNRQSEFKNFPSEHDLLKFADENIFQPRLGALLNDVFLCCLPACFNPQNSHLRYSELPFRHPNGVPSIWLPSLFCVPQSFKDELLDGRITMATFPGVAACFSTLELIAGLWAGKIRDKGGVDYPSVFAYARRFMGYDRKKLELAFSLFRHKIAHTSTPASHVLFPEKKISISQGGRRMRFAAKRRFSWQITVGGQHENLHIERLRGKALLGIGNLPAKIPQYQLTIDLGEFVSDLFRSVYRERPGFKTDLERNVDGAQKKFDEAVGNLYRL